VANSGLALREGTRLTSNHSSQVPEHESAMKSIALDDNLIRRHRVGGASLAASANDAGASHHPHQLSANQSTSAALISALAAAAAAAMAMFHVLDQSPLCGYLMHDLLFIYLAFFQSSSHVEFSVAASVNSKFCTLHLPYLALRKFEYFAIGL